MFLSFQTHLCNHDFHFSFRTSKETRGGRKNTRKSGVSSSLVSELSVIFLVMRKRPETAQETWMEPCEISPRPPERGVIIRTITCHGHTAGKWQTCEWTQVYFQLTSIHPLSSVMRLRGLDYYMQLVIFNVFKIQRERAVSVSLSPLHVYRDWNINIDTSVSFNLSILSKQQHW